VQIRELVKPFLPKWKFFQIRMIVEDFITKSGAIQ
jgi:hypothetical protein